MNFHALAPKKYKRAVVTGFIYRIYRACSDWKNVHESLETAKGILKMNQYPPDFYEPIIRDTLSRIISSESKRDKEKDENTEKPYMIFLEYRGKCSEAYSRDIRRLCTSSAVTSVQCKVVFTLRKLKTVLPSIKEPVEKCLRSGLVYKITCSHCEVCYVGKTRRHLQARVKEHLKKGPVKDHLETCVGGITQDSVDILGSTSKGEMHLLTLEALWIREIKPFLNTQDTMRNRDLKLTIKL